MFLVDTAPAVGREIDESAARRTLRGQLARLEAELSRQATGARPVLPVPSVVGGASLGAGVAGRGAGAAGRARVLSLADLEAARDRLIDQVAEITALRAEHEAHHAEARMLLEEMYLAPGEHRWTRISRDDLGEPGCGHYHVVPRLGIIGMLAGWWHVKVSSGCPLAWGRS